MRDEQIKMVKTERRGEKAMAYGTIKIRNSQMRGEILVDVFEELPEIEVDDLRHAVKAIEPIEFVFVVVGGWALEKFVLEPLLGPLAEKWRLAVKSFTSPLHSFRLIVYIQEENWRIDTSSFDNEVMQTQAWYIVWRTVQLKKQHNLNVDKLGITLVRNMAYAVAWKDDKQIGVIDLNTGVFTKGKD